jgi:F-type H+-transporting ATPase subunit a
VIDFAVGLLELISEFSKILSFAFRLFGNIFAGSVLLFVIGSLVPVFAQTGFLMLEFFVGLIQAIVFGMLTMTFMSQATQGHGGEHEEAQA